MSAGNEGFSPAPVMERAAEAPKKSETKSKKKAKEAPKLGWAAVEQPKARWDTPKAAEKADKSAAEGIWQRPPQPEASTAGTAKTEAKTSALSPEAVAESATAPLSPEAVTAKLQAAEKSLPAADSHEFGLAGDAKAAERELDQTTPAEDRLIVQVATQELARDRQKTMPEARAAGDLTEANSGEAVGDQLASEFVAEVAGGKDQDAVFADKLQAAGARADRIAAALQETALPTPDLAAEAEPAPEPGLAAEAAPATGPAAAEAADGDTEEVVEPDETDEAEAPAEADTEALPDPAESAAEAAPDDDEADPFDPVTPTGGAGGTAGGTPTGPPAPPTGGGPGGPRGGGPVPPFGPGGAPGGPGGFGTPAAAHFAPVLTPTPNALRTPDVRGGNVIGGVLVGGIIGYMIGRRGGRIRTEARLLPVQKQLEKRVNNLQWQLQEREAIIRRTAAEAVDKSRVSGFFGGSGLLQHREQRPAAAMAGRETPLKPERTVNVRRPAPEARQLHGKQPATERIGHMLMAAEAPAALVDRLRPGQKLTPELPAANATMRQTAEAAPEAPQPLTAKRIETLNRAELLELSERVTVEGSTLRQIYENHLVGERGLRRLLTEYMHGGDIKKALKNEILEREIDFERDPAMRDQAQQSGGTATGGGTAALSTLIAKAAASVDGGPAETQAFTDRSNQEIIQQERDRQRQLVDVGMGVVIAVLAVAVVILFMTRG